MLEAMRRLITTVLVIAIVVFLGYATLVSHAQRPCLEPHLTNACKKFLESGQK
jgi:hypothetical protein